MKHNIFAHYYEKANPRGRFLMLGILCLLNFSPGFLNAQCTALACNDGLQVAYDVDCTATITSAFIMSGNSCPGPKTIEVYAQGGGLIVSGTDSVVIPGGFENTTVNVILIDITTGLTCDTDVFLEDTLPPTFIQCEADTIYCTDPSDVGSVSLVIIEDACDPNPMLTFVQTDFAENCTNPDFIDVIVRTWTATDATGNTSICTQQINIMKPDLSDVEFPANLILDCEDSTDPTDTGFPTINGNPIVNGSSCNFSVVPDDLIAPGCSDADFQILRNWIITDHCTGTIIDSTQIIVVQDNTPPVINCPDDITVGTDPGVCTATILLNEPIVTDNCSGDTVVVATSYGQTTIDPFPGVPVGVHTVTFGASDDCNNLINCSFNVTVIDDEEPVAVCDEITNVSLPSGGIATVSAAVFDDGSTDNCGSVFFLVSRDMVNFEPTVTFDCDDAGDTVQIALQVLEVGDTTSASICMIQVEVEDKLPPVIACPINLTVGCENDFDDLSVFGSPTHFDNCNDTLTVSTVDSIGVCGVGNFFITYTATDDFGNTASCTQTVTVVNNNPLTGADITFPPDYTTYEECIHPDSLDPGDLPVTPINYSEPVISDVNCSLIATSYNDQMFNIEYPACYKILRNWSVIDWCQYDPSASNPVGIWSDQQLIKVLDSIPPVITCPQNEVFGLGNDCLDGVVLLDPAVADDCSPGLEITNNSPFADESGANASGSYPEGIYDITFTASDGCGNSTSCITTVTIEDTKAPTPYCMEGIIGELQEMGGAIMLMVDAELLDFASFDNCTSQENLVFNIGPLGDTIPPSTTMLTFDCLHIGINDVLLWVTDESGNFDVCQTHIEVQDNMELCGSGSMAGISGDIETELGDDVEEVMVTISSNSNALPDLTGIEGSFAVPNLPLGQTYTVVPEKDINSDNGITTFDLVLMSRHVLDIDPLDSPYKIIAADVNNSGSVTTVDIVQVRKMVLDLAEEFPNNTSWRFIDKNYDFEDPENPFTEEFPEIVTIEDLPPQGAESNFYGIKIGDLNYSATPNSLLGADDRSFAGELILELDNQKIKEGQEVEVAFKAKDFNHILGCQFTLEFDESAIEFAGFENGQLLSMTAENFNFEISNEGAITCSWFDLDKPKIRDREILFILKFKALVDADLEDLIHMNSSITSVEAYNQDEELLEMHLQFEESLGSAKDFELFQNRPNPFSQETRISFYLPEASATTLTIFDTSGRVLKQTQSYFEKGSNEIIVRAADLNSTGVLYFRLETETGTATRKMIIN